MDARAGRKPDPWRTARWMCGLMVPVSRAEAAMIGCGIVCILFGKWLDVKAVKKRGKMIDALKKAFASSGRGDTSVRRCIWDFVATRMLSSALIGGKRLIFTAVAARAVQEVTSEIFYFAVSSGCVQKPEITKMSRTVERGGKEVSNFLVRVFTVGVPSVVRLVLVLWEICTGFGARYSVAILVATVLYIVYTMAMFRMRARCRREMNRTDNRMFRRIRETIANMDLVRVHGNEYVEVGRFLKEVWRMRVLRMRDALYFGVSDFGQGALYTLLFAQVAITGCTDAAIRTCTAGDISVLFSFIFSVDAAMCVLGTMTRDLSFSFVDCTELMGFYEEVKAAAGEKAGYGAATAVKEMGVRFEKLGTADSRCVPGACGRECGPGGEIVFENVSFAYDRAAVLRNVSLSIGRGEKVAVVGASGSGKSTLVRLALGLHRYSGRILVRGVEASSAEMAECRGEIGCVLQDVQMFDETLLYNVWYGMPERRLERVAEECRRGLARVVTQRRGGELCNVGEGGTLLSRGEVQLVAVARCMFRDAELMLLDEATAGLGADAQRDVVEAILGAVRKTVVMVVHNLWIAERMDRIVVLESGMVVEAGSHAELVAQRGKYWAMWSSNQETYGAQRTLGVEHE